MAVIPVHNAQVDFQLRMSSKLRSQAAGTARTAASRVTPQLARNSVFQSGHTGKQNSPVTPSQTIARMRRAVLLRCLYSQPMHCMVHDAMLASKSENSHSSRSKTPRAFSPVCTSMSTCVRSYWMSSTRTSTRKRQGNVSRTELAYDHNVIHRLRACTACLCTATVKARPHSSLQPQPLRGLQGRRPGPVS